MGFGKQIVQAMCKMKSRIVYPRERKKYRRPSRINWKFVMITGLFFVLVMLLLYTFHLPALQVTKITISGNKILPEKIIYQKANDALEGSFVFVLPRRFFFAIRESSLADEYKKTFTIIESVQVTKEFPNSIHIELSERKFFGVICNNLRDESDETHVSTSSPVDLSLENTTENMPQNHALLCAYIDNKGFAYQEAPDTSGSLIVRITTDQNISIPSQSIDRKLFSQMQYLIAHIPEAAGVRINGFEVPSHLPSEFRAITSAGFKLLLKRGDDMEKILGVLKAVLDNEVKERKERLKYVDLRFENKVFYKFK